MHARMRWAGTATTGHFCRIYLGMQPGTAPNRSRCWKCRVLNDVADGRSELRPILNESGHMFVARLLIIKMGQIRC